MSPWRLISSFAAVVILACVLFFLAFTSLIAPRFAAIYQDFGGELPLLTRVAMKPATSFVALLFLGVGAAAGIVRPQERALILSLTAGGGMALSLGAVLAVYLPIFTLAASIN